MWTQGTLLASQDKIPDIPNFSKNDNSKVINVLSGKLHLYSAHRGTQQPEAGIGEYKQCRCHKPHSLRSSLWPTRTAQLALPSCPVSGAASPRQRQFFPVHSPSVQGVSSSTVFPLAQRAACTDACCVPVQRQHTNTQTCKPAAPAVRQCYGCSTQLCLIFPTATAAEKPQGPLSSLALTGLQKWKLVFLIPANSQHVSSHKPGYEQGHSFRPLTFPLLPNKSYICAVSLLQNLHLCLPAPLAVACPQEVLMYNIFSPSTVKQMLKVLAMLEKQRSILPPQLKNDLADSVCLSCKLLGHHPFLDGKEQMALFHYLVGN